MAKRLLDFAVLDQESAGHALDVTSGQSHEIAVHPGKQHPGDALAVEILPQFGVSQAERLIEFAFGIGKPRQVIEPIGSKEFRGAFLVAEVNKGERRSPRFDLWTDTAKLGDRLAAEGSTEVAEEDKQNAM